MIDIHFHCLPGIDDGPQTWDDAVALCRAAEADGTDTIIATPHVFRDAWVNDDSNARDLLIVELNARLGGRPAILPGCEYYFSADAVALWQLGPRGPLTALNRSSNLLMEFPATYIPNGAEAVLHELSLLGVRPIIAHPERNLVLSQEPDELGRLVQLGAWTQVTAGSVTGAFGKRAQMVCDEFFSRGLVHFVASDAHSLDSRPPLLAAARQRVRREWGPEAEERIFDQQPEVAREVPARC